MSSMIHSSRALAMATLFHSRSSVNGRSSILICKITKKNLFILLDFKDILLNGQPLHSENVKSVQN